MAEVFLALQEGIGGFEKLVVIKRIFKHFCEDEGFVQMFLDEARLAASIRHPNVVEILDIRKDDDGFFIVMEYLSGENLAYVFEELQERGRLMPAHLVCRVGAEIAGGLHSAHISADVDGELQPIVHRDVTPSNLIICFNGVIKIVDFGVAKANVENRQTRPGTLKGKIEYLAPEQVDNGPVTPRTDVFQLGVVLHELFTGERLFSGDSDHAIMTAVLERPIPPPSDLRGDLPRQVDDVIMGALEREPDKRTATADELRRGLEGVMRHLGTGATQRSLSDWMQATFADRHAERVKVERECVQNVRAGRHSSEIPAVLTPFAPTAPVLYEAERATAATRAERPSRRLATRRPHRSRGRAYIAVGAVAALAVLAYLWLRPGETPPSSASAAAGRDAGHQLAAADHPPLERAPVAPGPADAAAAEPADFEVVVRTRPEDAEVLFDGDISGIGGLSVTLPRDGTSHRITVRADGYQAQTIVFRDAPPPELVELEPVPETPVARRDWKRDRPVVESEAGDEPAQGSPAGESSGRNDRSGDEREPGRPPTDNRDPWER